MPEEPTTAEPLHGDDFVLRAASDFRPEPIEWLWPGRIAFGQLTVLEGDPGLGKSMLTAAIAASVTGGPALPRAPALTPSACIFANLEDDPGSVTAPRLRAAGADLDRVHVPEIGQGANSRLLSLPKDLDRLWEMVHLTRSRLVVIDPLMAALGTEINADNDQQTRTVLNELVQIASARKTAIMLVRHLNKQAGSKAIYRGGGSIGIAAAARSVLLLARNREGPGLLLSSTKQNLSSTPKTLALHIADGRVVWDGERDLSSDELVESGTPGGRSSVGRPPQVDVAADWLADNLCNVTRPSQEVFAAARNDGIFDKSLRVAARSVGVQMYKEPGARSGAWQWKLDGDICNPDDSGGQ